MGVRVFESQHRRTAQFMVGGPERPGNRLARWLLTIAVMLTLCSFAVRPAAAQVVNVGDVGGTGGIRVEFWNPADGAFVWNASGFASSDPWTQSLRDAALRGIEYWWDVLGGTNTPGRDMTFRLVFDPGSGSLNAFSSNEEVLTGGRRTTLTQHVWADGGVTAGTDNIDTVLVFEDLPWTTALSGPLPSAGTGMEAVMIHEVAHSLGQSTANDGTWGDGGNLTVFEEMIVDSGGVPIVVGGAFTAAGAFFFNGANAVAVFGEAVPLTTQSLQKSHLGIDPLLMTHESFRNYPFFTEVELAVLQDLGYTINRGDFFGRSIYQPEANGFVGQQVNGTGFNSAATYGVGLHLFASNVNLVQDADLTASGAAGNGIRVDGVGNTVAIAPGVTVRTNGDRGVGVLVSNGSGNALVHRGTIEADTTTAGSEGTGIQIGFGSNLLGFDTLFPVTPFIRNSELVGDYLVDRVDVSGSISAGAGAGNVLEIDATAAVREINLMNGTALNGHIVNNSLTSATLNRPTLTFGRMADASGSATAAADPNFTLNYNGNIGGTTSMDFDFFDGQSVLGGTVAANSVRSRAGQTTFNGAANITNDATVNSGVLTFNGNTTATNVNVDAGARLQGTGPITATVNVDGTAAPGNSIGLMPVTGTWNQNTGSTFELELIPVPAAVLPGGIPGVTHDQVDVTGNAVIGAAPTTVNVLPGAGVYALGTRYTFLNTSAGVTGSFSTMTGAVFNNGNLLASLVHNANNVQLFINGTNISGNVGVVTGSHNERAIAAAMDLMAPQFVGNPGSDGALLVSQVSGLNGRALQAGLDTLSGELYASLASVNLQTSSRFVQVVTDRLSGSDRGMRGTALVRVVPVSGPATAGMPPGNSSVASDGSGRVRLVSQVGEPGRVVDPPSPDGPGAFAGPSSQPGVVRLEPVGGGPRGFGNDWPLVVSWATAYGTHGDIDASRNAGSIDFTQQATAFGIERHVSPSLILGVTGDISRTDAAVSTPASGADVETFHVGAYFNRLSRGRYLTGLLAYGYQDYETTRRVSAGGFNRTASANYYGNELVAYLERGMYLEGVAGRLQPLVSVQYISLQQDDFREVGAGAANLAVDSSAVDSLRTSLGFRLTPVLPDLLQDSVIPELRARWVHEFLDDEQSINVGFPGTVPQTFLIRGTEMGYDFALLGAGLTIYINESAHLYLDYDAQLSEGLTSQGGSAGLEIRW